MMAAHPATRSRRGASPPETVSAIPVNRREALGGVAQADVVPDAHALAVLLSLRSLAERLRTGLVREAATTA
jgi:hypothetical protein